MEQPDPKQGRSLDVHRKLFLGIVKISITSVFVRLYGLLSSRLSAFVGNDAWKSSQLLGTSEYSPSAIKLYSLQLEFSLSAASSWVFLGFRDGAGNL